MNVEIKDFKADVINRGILVSDMQKCYTANLVFESGDWLGISRYADEDSWYVDCRFGANGFPHFSHGTGDRSCSKMVLTDPDLISRLGALL